LQFLIYSSELNCFSSPI